jgi:aspartate racemase
MTLRETPRTLGLIGGLGPAATVHYYTQILAACAARGATPRLVMSHAEAEFVRERVGAGDAEGLADYLARHIAVVARAGADFAAIPAIAPHLCAPLLVGRIAIPLIDPIDALAAELRRRGLTRIGMLGSRWALESRFFGRLPQVEIVPPNAEETAIVHDIYMAIVASGAVSAEDIERLRTIARASLARDGLQAVALAGTDLAVAFDEATAGFPAVDCARVHIEALVQAMGV